VRYPTHRDGPLPLVVFAHGFALTPARYGRLLDAWARSGYVVASPIFPVEGANAPGGPSQSDLVNEPADLHFLISRLIAPHGRFAALVDPTKIAVAGQSDGGIAALSVAFDQRYRDRRIDAAVIMSGAPLSGFTGAAAGSPPLLAVQGTADPLNPANITASYYQRMRRPKFLLWLLGATHLPPYTSNDRWASVVTRTTTAFLNHYLKHAPLRSIISAATHPGVARISASP
jgi:predicted dienelactone hydrolase